MCSSDLSLSYMREYAIMKNVKFNAAVQSVSAACWDLFLELRSIAQPLPEGVVIEGNGTGYYNPVVDCLKGRSFEKRTIFTAVCPKTNRRMLIVPVQSFYGLKDLLGATTFEENDTTFDEGKCLVFFERYTEGKGPEVLIEQLSNWNNAYHNQTLKMANLLFTIGDYLV